MAVIAMFCGIIVSMYFFDNQRHKLTKLMADKDCFDGDYTFRN